MTARGVYPLRLSVLLLLAGVIPLRAQWIKTSGPDSVRAFAYGYARLENGSGMATLFAGTTHGIYRSVDEGITWTAINGGLTNLSIRGVAVLRDTVYAATQGGGVFQSGNGGATWSAVNTGLTNLNVQTLYVYGTDLFVGTQAGGVFRSANRAGTWSAVGTGLPNAAVNALHIYSGALYAGTDTGVFTATTNGGGSWSAVNPGFTNLKVSALLWDASYLYAGTGGGGYVLRTSSFPDPGWKLLDFQVASPPPVRALACPGPYADAIVPKLAGTAGSGTFFSSGGFDWSPINQGLTEMEVHAVGAWNQDLFAGTNGGVWRRPLAQVFTSVRLTRKEAPTDFRVTARGTVFFSLPVPAFVSLKVFDPQGKQVSSLRMEDLSAGSHAFRMDAALPNGIYVYRLQVGSSRPLSRKVLVH